MAGDDDVEEYWRIRLAVRDAIWDVIGTVVTVLVAVGLGVLGVALIAQGLATGGSPGLIPAAFGAVLLAGGATLLAREFSVWPFA